MQYRSPRRPGAVLENVPQVPLAPRAVHLGSFHAEGPVGGGLNRVRHWRPEARPSGAAVELRLRCEQLLATARASENPVAVFLVQRARPGPLGAVLSQHLKLLRASVSRAIPLRLWDVHPANLPDSIDSEGMRIALVALLALLLTGRNRLDASSAGLFIFRFGARTRSRRGRARRRNGGDASRRPTG